MTTGYRELELVVDGVWASEHPEQAIALCMKRVRSHLGLDNMRGDSVLRPKLKPEPKPKAKPKPKPKREPKPKKPKPVYPPPLDADGVPMVKATDLGPRLGYGRYSVKNWVVRGHIESVVQREWEGGRFYHYVSEAEAREYMTTRKKPQGRKRKGER